MIRTARIMQHWLLLGLVLICLSACGFHLRGVESARLPPELARLHVRMASGAYPPLLVEMRNALKNQAAVELVDSGTQPVPVLTLSGEVLENRVLAIAISGKVSDYLLNYRVSFSLVDATGQELISTQTIKLQREYTFDKLNVLAKEKEDEFLRREMQRDAVQQIIRQLASLNLPARP